MLCSSGCETAHMSFGHHLQGFPMNPGYSVMRHIQLLDRCSPYARQFPFTITEFQRIPREVRGVYGIWFRRRCVYVGKADLQPIARRLAQHWRYSHNARLQAWITSKGRQLRVSYLSISPRKDIAMYERYFIARFQPLANMVRYDMGSVVACAPNRSTD